MTQPRLWTRQLRLWPHSSKMTDSIAEVLNNDIFRCNTKREGKEDYEVYHGPIHKPQKYIQFMRPAATFT
jgi:hypothetical protein